ncbi:MAG: phage tail sheath family protein [Desulfuromonadaceae bacterium]
MPVQPTYPGVYIEEVPSGVRTITGVSTSVALFIGRTKQGPLNKPTLCLNFTEFSRNFGTDTSLGELTYSVRLFFENGGAQCYVIRIAHGATASEVTLKSESGVEVLKLEARNRGLAGETIRAVVSYNGQQPEVTFNLELFRWETVGGQLTRQGREYWPNLSMDPLGPRYAPAFLTQNSVLVNAAAAATVPAPGSGFSQSGRPVPHDSGTPATFPSSWAPLLGNSAGVAGNRFRISVDGSPYTDVDLSSLNVAGISPTGANTAAKLADTKQKLSSMIKGAIDPELPLGKTVQVSFEDGPTPPSADGNATALLRISSTTGDVFIQPAATGDLAVPLMMGTAQGGLEMSCYASARPAPSGITLKALSALVGFAARPQNAFNTLTVNGSAIALGTTLQTVSTASPMFKDAYASSRTGNSDGVREKLAILQSAINNFASGHSTFRWKAEVWGSRLVLLPIEGSDNSIGTISTATTDIGGDFTKNVTRYSLGVGGLAGLQTPAAVPARDGDAPTPADYAGAYDEVVDKEIDLFNLLILPKDADHNESTTASLWGPASNYCLKRRAMLLMDAPADWKKVGDATKAVNLLRIGLVNDHSALFYPRLLVNDNGLSKAVGASGAIAGLMARIDSTRGVWKAPAGTEANLRGVAGLELAFSNQDNGVLNPRGINTLRVFPTGIVNWGARTMDGDDDFGSEWKYIPVRRLALFIEETLYRSTQWVVFESNDEPLWSQIRLNIGSFMHSLFRQGAFQGKSPKEAYFVKCDGETTTQDDINKGIVNILVGFAPLKPAEFVIIKLQQMAGQIQA